jgi:hypothetical protein
MPKDPYDYTDKNGLNHYSYGAVKGTHSIPQKRTEILLHNQVLTIESLEDIINLGVVLNAIHSEYERHYDDEGE